MRQREGAHDLHDVKKGGSKPGSRLPALAAYRRPHEHGRQQQGQQKKQVIEAGPDVAYALAGIVEKLFPPRRLAQCERLVRLLGAENAGAGGALILEAEQTAMLRGEIKKQPIANREYSRRGTASCSETQHFVGAVAMAIDQMLPDLRRTRRARGCAAMSACCALTSPHVMAPSWLASRPNA